MIVAEIVITGGTIETFGTWYGEAKRPCMVLLRRGTYGFGADRIMPSVISLAGRILK